MPILHYAEPFGDGYRFITDLDNQPSLSAGDFLPHEWSVVAVNKAAQMEVEEHFYGPH